MSSTTSLRWRTGASDHPAQPRERLFATGAGALTDVELLALCLGSGVSGEHVMDMAHRLLWQFRSPEGLLAAAPAHLLACHGLGPARVSLLKAVEEMARRSDERSLSQTGVMSDAVTVCRYVRRRIGFSAREVFGCLFLDARHRPIAWEILFQGTLTRAHVHSREVLRRGLELNAAAMVLGHNHPSGVAEPSAADLALTRELKDLLARVDICLLDHIVVSRHAAVSLAARGLMGE